MDTEVDAIVAKVQTMVKGRSTQVVDTVVNQVSRAPGSTRQRVQNQTRALRMCICLWRTGP